MVRQRNSRRFTRIGGGYEASTARAYYGGMRRCHLRGRDNILKRQLVHVGAFNLSLILRQLLSAGTPRELRNRSGRIVLSLLLLLWYRNDHQRCRSGRNPALAIEYVSKSRTRLRRMLCRKSTT